MANSAALIALKAFCVGGWSGHYECRPISNNSRGCEQICKTQLSAELSHMNSSKKVFISDITEDPKTITGFGDIGFGRIVKIIMRGGRESVCISVFYRNDWIKIDSSHGICLGWRSGECVSYEYIDASSINNGQRAAIVTKNYSYDNGVVQRVEFFEDAPSKVDFFDDQVRKLNANGGFGSLVGGFSRHSGRFSEFYREEAQNTCEYHNKKCRDGADIVAPAMNEDGDLAYDDARESVATIVGLSTFVVIVFAGYWRLINGETAE